jgi:predicted DNA-binding transcriptional regulator YafY
VDLYELARRYGVAVRTIRRDLDALRDAGLPIREEEADGGKRKRWTLDLRGQRQKLSSLLDVSHYLALRVAVGQGAAARTLTGVFATLEDLAAKIETAVGPRGRAQLQAIEACFHSYEKFAYRKAAPDVLWPLVTAITQRRVCHVTYQPPHAPSAHVLACLPLRLFTHDGAVYVMAHAEKHDSLITLNLQRLERLEVLGRTAEPPAGFDPEAIENAAFQLWTGGPPVTYRLRFDEVAAPYLRERLWHPGQTLVELEGGRVELTFTCAGSFEVAAWVASWRHHVEVLEPGELRQELAELGTHLVETYRPAGRARGRAVRRGAGS